MKVGDRIQSPASGAQGQISDLANERCKINWDTGGDTGQWYDPTRLVLLSGEADTGNEEVRVTDPTTGGQKGSKPQQPAQIPPRFLLALGQHFGEGQVKYPDAEPGRPNWSRGYAWSLSANALERHLLAWLAGEDYDEDGRHNLVAVGWHASVLYTFQTEDLGTDDRPAYYRGGADD